MQTETGKVENFTSGGERNIAEWIAADERLKEAAALAHWRIGECLSPLARKAPALYDFRTGKWNRKYLCVCAVYRLLKRKRIGQARALELLASRHSAKEMRTLRATVELWKQQPITDMLP